MKKKVLYFIGGIALVVLMAINVNFAISTEGDSYTISSILQKALADSEDAPYCHSGGTNSSQCSIEAGIEILGVGVTAGCSVTCNPGYYSCCSLRCTCEPE